MVTLSTPIMKTLLLISAALIFTSASFSQSALVGKWKPVFFSMDSFIRGDVKADTLFISQAMDSNFKKDKDPEASKEMVKMFVEILFGKIKVTMEEYTSDGK